MRPETGTETTRARGATKPERRNGVLLLDKPAGPTSHDVVRRVRRLARQRRVGHTGTLDPFATGLLGVCLGRATRLARFLSRAEKAYLATVRFGFATDTYDRTGTPVGDASESAPGGAAIEEALEAFRGRIDQSPPPFSAKKYGGERLHRLARRGAPVSAPPVSVEVHDVRLLDAEGDRATIELRVSSGTYVRAIAHELGERLGCGAHLDALTRTAIGSFRLEEAVPLDELEERAAVAGAEDALGEVLLSPGDALRDLPALVASGEAAEKIRHGRVVTLSELSGEPGPGVGREHRLLGPEGDLLAVGERLAAGEGDRIRPVLVFAT